jgi:YD repeat-containing protein
MFVPFLFVALIDKKNQMKKFGSCLLLIFICLGLYAQIPFPQTINNLFTNPHQLIYNQDGSRSYRQATLHTYARISGQYNPILSPGGLRSDGVDKFSGTNNINLPLWSVSGRGFPISLTLSYSSKGVKVSQISSNVGLGWNINAGGIIRRITRGIPDDYNGTMGMTQPQSGWITDQLGHGSINLYTNNLSISEEIYNWNPNTDANCLSHILGYNQSDPLCFASVNPSSDLRPNHDTESDLYIIEGPNLNGSFIFSNQQTDDKLPIIRSIGQSNLKIIPHFSQNGTYLEIPIESFEIIDENGNTFYFDLHEKAYLLRTDINATNAFLSAAYSFETAHAWDYVSGWFLTKIITYLGDEIEFSYEKEEYIMDPTNIDFTRAEDPNQQANIFKGYKSKLLNEAWDITNADYIETYRISNITGSDFIIDFIANNNRNDLLAKNQYYNTPKSIDIINIYRRLSADITDVEFQRRFEFFYSYTYAENTNNCPIFHPDLLNPARYRLILDKLIESGKKQTFSPYTFEYYSNPYQSITSLPCRFSYNQDIWGFYNDASNSSLTPEIYIFPERTYEYMFNGSSYSFKDRFWLFDIGESPVITLDGADRLPEEESCKRGSLIAINYPSGARREFDYELNEFNYKDETIEGAGLRLQKETIKENNIPISIKEYFYEDGEALGFPIYGYFDPLIQGSLTDYQYYNAFYVRSNCNLSNTNDEIGYGKVSMKTSGQENKGKTIWYYENSPNISVPISLFPSIDYYSPTEATSVPEYIPLSSNPFCCINDVSDDFDRYPYHSIVNVDWFRGRLKSMEYRNANDDIVKKTEYEYQCRYLGDGVSTQIDGMDKVIGMKVGFLQSGTGGSSSNPVASVIKNVTYTGVASLPIRITTTNYDDYGNALTEIIDHEYSKYNQLKTTSKINSDGTKSIVEYKRPLDYFDVKTDVFNNPTDPNGLAIYKLAEQNSLNTIVEQINKIQYPNNTEYVVGGKISLFKQIDNNSPYPCLPAQDLYLATNEPLSTDPNNPDFFEESNRTGNPTYTFLYDDRYKARNNYLEYDDNFRLITSKNEDNVLYAFKWDPYLDKTIANATNAMGYEIDFTGYDFGHGNGDIVESTLSNPAFFGKYMQRIYAYNVEDTEIQITFESSSPPSNKGYTASAWVKGEEGVHLRMKATFSGFQTLYSTAVNNNGHANEWCLLKTEISEQELATYANCQSIMVQIDNQSSQHAYVDEVKIHPSDIALFSTKNYDDNGNTIGESNTNDIYIKYEYDDLDRITITRNDNDEIINVNEYGTGNPAIFTWDDTGGGGSLSNIPEANEQLTISVNTPDLPGASYEYMYYLQDSSPPSSYTQDDDGIFTLSLSEGIYLIKVKVSINGYSDFEFVRSIQVY